MDELLVDKISTLVLKKSELRGLSKEVVNKAIKAYFKKNNFHLSNPGKKDILLIVKSIRNELRKFAGQFRDKKDSDSLSMNSLEKEEITKLLRTHSSTSERIDFYPELISKIKSLNPKSILDLGCGLNPLALADSSIRYYALDIIDDELDIIKKYFLKENILGEVLRKDLRDIEEIKESLPSVDLCIIMKVFDILEKRGHKLAEKILLAINTKHFLISFSTKTLSGKPMNHPQRGWIERLLTRLNFSYSTFKSKNEIFYLAERR